MRRALLFLLSLPAWSQIAPLPNFDPRSLDKAADPCVDFYQYACGAWMPAHPVPPDQSRWGRFEQLRERVEATLLEILQQGATPRPGRSASEQRIGDYYAACLDESAIDQHGLAPLKALFDSIEQVKSPSDLAGELARLHRIRVPALFRLNATPDPQNASRTIADLDQPFLGLPEREYYTSADPGILAVRRQYMDHMIAMFGLLGIARDPAAARAEAVLRIETQLATASLERVTRQDPVRLQHSWTIADLESATPLIDWKAYFQAMSANAGESLNMSVPEYFRALNRVLGQAPIEDLRAYLTWSLLRSSARLLPSPLAAENFRFYGKVLAGSREQPPRWKRCAGLIDVQLADALGREFVERTFPPERRDRVLAMTQALVRAFERDLQTLDWMEPATRREAIAKLRGLGVKIGHPDHWRDYAGLRITRDDALGNYQRASEWAVADDLSRIGGPVDKSRWVISATTVDAFYRASANEIVFPAGILQPPYYDEHLDEAVNLGTLGAIMGHEITHAFDTQGRKFDAAGNLRDWWTPADAREFEKRAQCLIDQYSEYTVVGDVKLNGKLTIPENTADHGGLRAAYMALMELGADRRSGMIDGFTALQRLFLGYAQTWCSNNTEAGSRLRAKSDPHAPGRYRVNGVVSDMPEFREAFACKTGQPMVRYPACRVW